MTTGTREERQTLHVMDDQRRVAMVETKTWENDVEVDSPVSRWLYQLENHLGSSSMELDHLGAVVSYEEYHPYGTTAFHTPRGGAEVSAKRYRYTGKERDEETGLYYHGARYYAPWLGRWSAADPLGLLDGPNLYSYVRGNPISSFDPTGFQTEQPTPGPGSRPLPRHPPPPPPVEPSPQARPRTNPNSLQTQPRPSPPVGPRVAPPPLGVGALFAGAVAFFATLLLPSNAFTDYTVTYEDPETGETLKFANADDLQGYLNKKSEKIAPGRGDISGDVEAPSAAPSGSKAEAPSAELEGLSRKAPAPSDVQQPVAAPGSRSPNEGPVEAQGGEPAPSNYRGRYNAERARQGKARLPIDWDAHHRIPQAYRGHPEFEDFDFDAPENIQGVKGSRADKNVHQRITDDWKAFRKLNPNATREQIEEFARKIDRNFHGDWWK